MRRPPAIALALAALLAGCGNERTQPPDVRTPADPAGTTQVVLDAAGVEFAAPANWRPLARAGSLAGGVSSSRATVAVWHYPRSEPLPRTPAAVRRAAQALVARVRERDRSFELGESTVTRRRIELRGTQEIAGRRVEVRSLHVFARGSEIVFDAYAPPEHFERLDRSVFRPLLASVQLR